jgi:hypothetical protein
MFRFPPLVETMPARACDDALALSDIIITPITIITERIKDNVFFIVSPLFDL